MAKQPESRQAKTRLCPPYTPEQAAALAEAFLQDTITGLARADCAETLLAFAPPESAAWFAATFPNLIRIPQSEGDLGARLIGALDAAWNRGYGSCILLGADSPHLPADCLRAAFAALQPGAEPADVVLGPAEDGGYYLLGLNARCPSLFQEIAWSTSHVLAQTRTRAESLGLRVHLLPPWYDIDIPADLDRLRTYLRTALPDVCPATRRLLQTV
jgi:rSAM/selenodomain-associated transferase 1